MKSQWRCVIVVFMAFGLIVLMTTGAAHGQSPDTSQLRAGAAYVGLVPGQRIRYSIVNSRWPRIDSIRGFALDTLWLVSGGRVPVAGITSLQASRGKPEKRRDRARRAALWGAAAGATLGVLVPVDSSAPHGPPSVLTQAVVAAGMGAVLGAYYVARDTGVEQWRSISLDPVRMGHASTPASNSTSARQITRFIDSSAVRSFLHSDTGASGPTVVVRSRPTMPWILTLLEEPPEKRVANIFKGAGYRTVVAPVRGDTFGLGDDGLREGHERLARGLTGAVLGGVEPPPRLPQMRAAMSKSLGSGVANHAAAAVLVVCDHSGIDRALVQTEHWECSIFDVMSGRLIYAGGGEDVGALNPSITRGLERALAGFFSLRAGP